LTELEGLEDELTVLDREAEEAAATSAALALEEELELEQELELEELIDDDPELDEPAQDEPTGPTDDDLAVLETQLDTIAEEEQEYVEFVEAREALLDVAIQVESVAMAKSKRIASELAEQHHAAAVAAAEHTT